MVSKDNTIHKYYNRMFSYLKLNYYFDHIGWSYDYRTAIYQKFENYSATKKSF